MVQSVARNKKLCQFSNKLVDKNSKQENRQLYILFLMATVTDTDVQILFDIIMMDKTFFINQLGDSRLNELKICQTIWIPQHDYDSMYRTRAIINRSLSITALFQQLHIFKGILPIIKETPTCYKMKKIIETTGNNCVRMVGMYYVVHKYI